MKVLEALWALLQDWMPLAFVCGRLARSCVWEGRKRGSGVIAKEVVMACLLGLLPLKGTRAHTVEYVRTLSCALVLWSGWHTRIPGACYSDESNESSLSQLGEWWENHPEIITVQQVSDLFLLLPESRPKRDLPAGSCSRVLFDRIVSGVRALTTGAVAHMAYVEWDGGGSPVRVQAAWPADHRFPPTIRVAPKQKHVNNIFKYNLSRLVTQPPTAPHITAALDRLNLPR